MNKQEVTVSRKNALRLHKEKTLREFRLKKEQQLQLYIIKAISTEYVVVQFERIMYKCLRLRTGDIFFIITAAVLCKKT